MPIEKEMSNMLDLGQKPFQLLFTLKLAKITKDKCSHCAMTFDNQFRCLSTAPSNRIITLWVHPFRATVSIFPFVTLGVSFYSYPGVVIF